MSIDLNAQATLNGAPLSSGFIRSGTLGNGTVAEMVLLGLEYMQKDYVAVAVFYHGGILDSEEIKRQAERDDFPGRSAL